MPAPTEPPFHDAAASIAVYRPGDLVWVLRGDRRPGVVLSASSTAAMVRYSPHGRAVGVDTVLAGDLSRRTEIDPVIDPALRAAAQPASAALPATRQRAGRTSAGRPEPR